MFVQPSGSIWKNTPVQHLAAQREETNRSPADTCVFTTTNHYCTQVLMSAACVRMMLSFFGGGEEFLKKHFLCQTFFNKQKVTTKA